MAASSPRTPAQLRRWSDAHQNHQWGLAAIFDAVRHPRLSPNDVTGSGINHLIAYCETSLSLNNIVKLILIGMIMASAFPAILVYAMDLMPGRVGVIAGVFYGVSFGMGALSAAALGHLADLTSIDTVYGLCAYLPALGLLAWFLPTSTSTGAKPAH